MPDLTLGSKPVTLNVVLTRHVGFAVALKVKGGMTFEDGDDLRLIFDQGMPFVATLAGDTATWGIPAIDVDALIATGARYANLWFTGAGGQPERWAAGSIEVFQ